MDRKALLVMDYQVGVVERFIEGTQLLGKARSALEAARGATMPVIFVRVAFRKGWPEISPTNKSFASIATGGANFDESAPETQVHPMLAPQPGDIVITKRRVGAFSGSDLEVVLRSNGIDTLVLSGIATSGVVLSTVRQAADMDYRLVVLSDACADADDEVHRVLIEKLFPRQAEVLTVSEWIASLPKH
jgi:nicotinamidase-related amidase